jgi:signal transduction histidine kinase
VDTGLASHISLSQPPGSLLAIMPLRAPDRPLGVVELLWEGPSEEHAGTLQGLADHSAGVLAAVQARETLQRQVDTLAGSAGLAAAMLGARTIPACTRAAARYCHERLALPVASWWAKGDPGRLAFLAAYGLGARRRAHLRQAMDPLPALAALSEDERAQHLDQFREVTGFDRVSVVDAGSAVLLVAGDVDGLEEGLVVVRSLLTEATRNLEQVLAVDQRDARVDLGLAWTAHEISGPLHAVKAVIDLLLATTGPEQPLRDLLGRSSRELDDLAGQVDTVLRWAGGPAKLRRRSRNVVNVVRRVIESCSLDSESGRVTLTGAPQAMAFVDEAQLRSALANLIRNALAYSSSENPIEVRVRSSDDHVLVSVLDRGRGVSQSESDRIFDPFVRGRASQGRRTGAGLGLFIARRIVEAHGGSLWAEPVNDGGRFHVALPRAARRGDHAASSGSGPVPS